MSVEFQIDPHEPLALQARVVQFGVLVVEDEPRIAADVAAALKSAGFVPEIGSDGEDAWFKGDTEDYAGDRA